MKITEGQKAPDFTLPNQDGENRTLSDYAGQFVVLYFYPKDGTPDCTIEAQVFRDALDQLKEHDIAVLGVSADSVESHKEFHENENLPFDILSDEEANVIEQYDCKAAMEDDQGQKQTIAQRNTFIINPDGDVAKIYENVEPSKHVEEIIEDIQSMK